MQIFTRFYHFACAILSLAIAAGSVGCSREWYRQQADDEVVDAVSEKHGYFDHGDLTADPDSRLYDPYDPNATPLPPDDPASHQLMHEVDGKSGYECWHANGDATSVDFGLWMNSLPQQADGTIILNLAGAVRVARKHSRDYQTELEDLYLSALDVTFERFRFDTQFFLGNTTQATFDGRDRGGRGDSSTLETITDAEMRKLTATGGELVVGLANSLVWEFSGRDTDRFGSVLDFGLVQPLLRFGGRARVLETLTQSERTLLANVRQMEQYRRGFYVEIVAGRNSGDGPIRRGPVGANGLGFLAGLPSGRSGAAPVGGFLGVLQEQVQIRNRASNLAALRDSVVQLEALFESNRLPNRLQVDQTRQAYYNAQSNLLSSKAGYASRVDAFKMSLGLPPTLPLEVRDALIERFDLIDPRLTDLQNDLTDVLQKLRVLSVPPEQIGLADRQAELLDLKPRIDAQLEIARGELERLQANVPERLKQLQRLQRRIADVRADVDPRVYDAELTQQRILQVATRFPRLTAEINAAFAAIRDVSTETLTENSEVARDRLKEKATEVSGLLVDVLLFQAAVRLESIGLVPVQLEEAEAMEIARCNRLDWMNARANLVDAWRKIEFDANALQSDLNLVISGDIGTRGDNPVEFRAENSRLRFGLEFDSPITRVAERNRYRETLIAYQRARRDYMLFEDEISQSLRNTLRIIDLSQINFEIRRAALLVAISQVGFTRIRLMEPPKAQAQAAQLASTQVSPTTARDLVSALSDLLDSQNDFLNAWVSHEVLRLLLDFELGTMQLDDDGLWVDPGPLVPSENESVVPAEPLRLELPTPESVPPPLPENRDGTARRKSPQQDAIKPAGGWRPTKKSSRPDGLPR